MDTPTDAYVEQDDDDWCYNRAVGYSGCTALTKRDAITAAALALLEAVEAQEKRNGEPIEGFEDAPWLDIWPLEPAVLAAARAFRGALTQ